jgi:hypothetical protein
VGRAVQPRAAQQAQGRLVAQAQGATTQLGEVAERQTSLGITQHLGPHPGRGKQLVTGDAQLLDQVEQGGSVGDRYQFGREIQGYFHGLSGGDGHI